MNSVRKAFLLVLFVALPGLNGCAPFLPIPTGIPEPYNETTLGRLQVGKSSRDGVASVLGHADAQLDGGRIWIYGQSRMITVDGIQQYQSLLVMFEGETLDYYEALEARYGCWDAGLCLVSGWVGVAVGREPLRLEREKIAVVTKRQDDSEARHFEPGAGQCAVYVYKKANLILGRDYPPAVTLGSLRDEPLHYKGYIFHVLPAGPRRLTVEGEIAEFNCPGGARMYFEVVQDVHLSSSELLIHNVPPGKGEEALGDRNLLITW